MTLTFDYRICLKINRDHLLSRSIHWPSLASFKKRGQKILWADSICTKTRTLTLTIDHVSAQLVYRPMDRRTGARQYDLFPGTHAHMLKRHGCPFRQKIFFPDTFPVRNSLFGDTLYIQTMQHLFTMFNVQILLQFLQECDFYKKFNKFYLCTIYAQFLSNMISILTL